MEVPVSFADAFHLCKESIHQLNRARIIEEDAQKGSIRVKTGMSIRTWGDVVQYKVKKVSDSKAYDVH
ncbi:hypothetical protein [Halalkalibacter okhensis]|uniref:Uncharacterized protein n=1 Tax=Halalkalibacter okhensis TaxID=333138 RepID=A0A0B0IG96_9BACI|nr:hypothetical protein [Halalkalibacter okhensis]KHF41628.1 hypothetical protein LQ50_02705 [Halalkalibacter okhensis]